MLDTQHPEGESNPLWLPFEGKTWKLIITTRYYPALTQLELQQIILATVRRWCQVYQAFRHDSELALDLKSPEKEVIGEKAIMDEAFNDMTYAIVTVWAYDDEITPTVQSNATGHGALMACKAALAAYDDIARDMEEKGIKIEYKFRDPHTATPPPNKSQTAPQAPKNAQNSVATPDSGGNSRESDAEWLERHKPQNEGDATSDYREMMPMKLRFFKSAGEAGILLQEFKKGGGEKYQKMAFFANKPYDSKAVQYDDDTLVAYPITGEVKIVETKYGMASIIPTPNADVWVNHTRKDGSENTDWIEMKKDLTMDGISAVEELTSGWHDTRYANHCYLVLKMSTSNDMQWKNYYHIYQPLQD